MNTFRYQITYTLLILFFQCYSNNCHAENICIEYGKENVCLNESVSNDIKSNLASKMVSENAIFYSDYFSKRTCDSNLEFIYEHDLVKSIRIRYPLDSRGSKLESCFSTYVEKLKKQFNFQDAFNASHMTHGLRKGDLLAIINNDLIIISKYSILIQGEYYVCESCSALIITRDDLPKIYHK